MNLDNFSAFFQFFAGLNFLYAGSEAFRYAVNDTFLKLGETMTGIRTGLETQISYLVVSQAENKEIIARALTVVENQQKANKLMEREEKLRGFPRGCRSMFLATGLFCLAVILLGGFEQFFFCSEYVNITLLFLNGIILYNVFIFVRSLMISKCEHNVSPLFPIIAIICLIGLSAVACSFLPYMAEHTLRHLGNNPAPKFEPHSTFILEQLNVSIALLTCTSPFLIHFLRVFIHKQGFKPLLEKMNTTLKEENERIEKAQNLLAKPSCDAIVATEPGTLLVRRVIEPKQEG